jgi:UDP-N-acetylglucosamine transferase subunit ALG13
MRSRTEPSLILLSLGTHHQPFVRALSLVEPLAIEGAAVFIQHGSTPPRLDMPNSRWVEFMTYTDMAAIMQNASSVICHAGVGTIMTALSEGHTPIVIPRYAKYGEHVDNHQVDIATRFADRGLVRCITPGMTLRDVVTRGNASVAHALGRGSRQLREAVVAAVAAEPHGRHHVLSRVRA